MKNKHSTKAAIAVQSIENLLDKKIVTADGKTLGHVIDIQLSQDAKYRIIALMYGYDSLLYRLHVFEPVARAFHFHQEPKKIPWEAVKRVDQSAIWLKGEK
jgi:sporulation protein YlmC with PRC-barrel domain